jgi:hypothetical protein
MHLGEVAINARWIVNQGASDFPLAVSSVARTVETLPLVGDLKQSFGTKKQDLMARAR